MITRKFCSFCGNFTFTKLDDFDEVGWNAVRTRGQTIIACPDHLGRLKEKIKEVFRDEQV